VEKTYFVLGTERSWPSLYHVTVTGLPDLTVAVRKAVVGRDGPYTRKPPDSLPETSLLLIRAPAPAR
jgi:hypothetical protein